MRKKIIISILCFSLVSHAAFAEAINLDQEKSRIHYVFSYLNVPVKKKFLPATGHIDLVEGDNNSLYLKGLDLDVDFTSKSSLFRKAINYDKYPDFKFFTELENPIEVSNKKFVELEGYLSFHGITQKIKIKLKNKMTKEGISLIGFFNIKMTDFGIKPPKIFFIILDNVIKSKVELYSSQLCSVAKW